MATYVLKRKLFTTMEQWKALKNSVSPEQWANLSNTGRKNLMDTRSQMAGVKDRLTNIDNNAVLRGDRGSRRAADLKAGQGVTGRYRATSNTTQQIYNRGFNAGMKSVKITPTTPTTSVGGVKGWWNGLGTGGKVGVGLAGAALVGGGIYAATRNKNKDN